MAETDRVLAVTICAHRKLGMSEEEYHEYISKKHAPIFKDLLLKNKIIGYTMVRFVPVHQGVRIESIERLGATQFRRHEEDRQAVIQQ